MNGTFDGVAYLKNGGEITHTGDWLDCADWAEGVKAEYDVKEISIRRRETKELCEMPV